MPLTWRNVDGPDFGRSLEGIRTFGNLFGGAVDNLNQGLSTFDAAQDKRANAGFAMDMLKYQDPAALKAALASGAAFAGTDPRRISQANIQAAGARVGDLLNQKVAEFGLTRDQYGFDRRQKEDAGLDKASPFVDEYLRTGKAPDGAFGGLGFKDRVNLTTGRQGYQMNDLGMDQTRLGMTVTGENLRQSKQQFAWATEDRAVADQADQVWATLQQNGFDGQEQSRMLNEMKGVNPKVYNAIIGRLNMGGGGSPAGGMISGAIGGGGGDALGKTYGGGSLPDSIQTVGQLVANKGNLVRSLGASPVGVYQINADTWADFGPKVLGKDWQNANVRDFAVQDAIGKKIFESTGGSPERLMARWASLDAPTAKRISKLSWEEARQEIARGESGADPRTLSTMKAAVSQGQATANMARNANGLAGTFIAKANDNSSVGDVVTQLTKDPNFAGMNAGYLTEQVRLAQAEARKQGKTINAAMAGEILHNSTSSGLWGRYAPTWLGGGTNAGVNIDGRAVKDYISGINEGDVDNLTLANANSAQAEGARAQAEGVYNAALARYQAGVAASQRGVNVNLEALQGNVNRASNMLAQATAAIGNNPSMARFGQRPQPVATTSGGGATPLRTRGPAPSGAAPLTRRQLWDRALAR